MLRCLLSQSFSEKLSRPEGFASSRLRANWRIADPKGRIALILANTPDSALTGEAVLAGVEDAETLKTFNLGVRESRIVELTL